MKYQVNSGWGDEGYGWLPYDYVLKDGLISFLPEKLEKLVRDPEPVKFQKRE